MPLLNWYDTYSVNNEELDNHHKVLFEIFNRLYDICVKKDKDTSFDSVTDELVEYSNYHFRAEEHYMRDTGYKGIDNHVMEHDYFTRKVRELAQMENKEDLEVRHDIIVFLGNWLLNHVMAEDKKISR